jgi:tetratricopeptide (TPR) repeat protein
MIINPCVNNQWVTRSAAVVLMTVLGACATSNTSSRPAATIAVQEDVGFTITEPVSVDNNVRTEYVEALNHLEHAQYEEGLAMLQQVANSAPDLSAPRIEMGIAYHAIGDLEAAEDTLLLALELNPDHPIAHNELGIVYRKTGRFAEARRSYESALAVYPGYHHARRNLGILCDLYMADLDCALENYEAYMKTVPSDDQAAMWIADIRGRLGQ